MNVTAPISVSNTSPCEAEYSRVTIHQRNAVGGMTVGGRHLTLLIYCQFVICYRPQGWRGVIFHFVCLSLRLYAGCLKTLWTNFDEFLEEYMGGLDV